MARSGRWRAGGDLESNEIAAGVLPVSPTQLATPKRLDVLDAWHRPRKQYVRRRQWMRLAEQLVDRATQKAEWDETRGARYLTLPGMDYLDVRLLASVCKRYQCDLTVTGFLAGNEENPVIARARMREEALIQANYITRDSHTYTQRFETVASTDGQTYRELRRRGPFHIVNIDACGTIAAPGADGTPRVIEALFRTVELQLERMVDTWMLFVTTDVRPERVSEDTMTKFCRTIEKNAKGNDRFGTRVIDVLASSGGDVESAILNARKTSGEAFVRLFALGLGKWLLRLAKKKGRRVKMHEAYCYSTMKGQVAPTMPCLAFEFVPPAPGLRDEACVVRARPKSGGAIVEDLSQRVADKVGGMVDVDRLLASDSGLKDEMNREMALLLKEAGYEEKALAELGGRTTR